MKCKNIFLLVGLLLLSLTPRNLLAQYKHPDLKNGKMVIKNVLLLPPSASLVKSSLKGGEPMLAESRTFEATLNSLVAQTLAAEGYKVVNDEFSPEALNQTPDLKYALSDLQTRYDKLHVLLKKNAKDVRKGRFTLGDEVANFTPGATADALVFVRADGVVTTGGKKAFSLITGVGDYRSLARIDFAVADARNGSILYFSKTRTQGRFVEGSENMKSDVMEPFSGFAPKPARKK